MTEQPPGTVPVRSSPDDEISLWEVLAVLLRRRDIILRSVLLLAFLAVAVTFLRARSYTTETSFQPQGSGGASELASLASQFGVRVGGATEGESPAFYAELVTSREILSRVAGSVYIIPDRGTGPLVDVLEIEADTEALRERAALEWLREEAVSVQTGRETGIVTLTVRTRWPELSAEIAGNILDEISRFNMETRQSQAAAERAFIEERMETVEAELRAAEAALLAHIQGNRQIGGSPELQYERERLQAEVLRRQQVYTTLVQSYEQARITEVRDTPVLTVLQSPYLPPAPDGRGLVLNTALGIVLGGMVGVVLAFLTEAMKRPAAGDRGPREEFRESWDDFLSSIPLVGRRENRA